MTNKEISILMDKEEFAIDYCSKLIENQARDLQINNGFSDEHLTKGARRLIDLVAARREHKAKYNTLKVVLQAKEGT